jgi:hypothetical protein
MLIIEQNENEKLSLLRQAIEDKVEISFWYRGVKVSDPKNKKYTKQNWRFAQPTDLGKSDGEGNRWMLRAYQKSGASNTNNKAWKTFLVDEMNNITLLNSDNKAYVLQNYGYFEKPDGPDFSLSGDEKMLNGKPEIKIDINKKRPENKPEEKPEEPQVQNVPAPKQQPQGQPQGQNDPENPNDNEVVTEHSSGFLKWIYNIYG